MLSCNLPPILQQIFTMRNATLLGLGLIALGSSSALSQCTDLFISEYLEGTGNNKGLEFYNPTSESISLNGYVLQRWSNGEAGMTDETNLVGTIPAYGTWVLVNGQTEDVDLGGGATSPMADPEMQALADQLDNPYPAPTYMNGDDALVLLNNGVPIDIFGRPGEDPGVAWTDDEANGFVDVGDGATWLTSNHTLRRKYEVMQGVVQPPVAFNTFLEWDTLEVNTWDGLGVHFCACDPNGLSAEPAAVQTAVFPNPAISGTPLQLTADAPIEQVTVHAANGQLVRDVHVGGDVRFELAGLPAGAYIVSMQLTGNRTFAHRVTIR